ncbi:hypothetical protein B0H10DRAFT_2338384, partial [Mycena sp. CBHHK59/15]
MDRQVLFITFLSVYLLVTLQRSSLLVHACIPKNSGGKGEGRKEKNAKSEPDVQIQTLDDFSIFIVALRLFTAYVATLLNAINRAPALCPQNGSQGLMQKCPNKVGGCIEAVSSGNYVKGPEMSVGVSSGTADANVSGHSTSISSAQGVLQSAEVDTQSVDEELLRAGGVAGSATQPDCGGL